MKVKISYTEDSEQVPRLINELLSKCRKKLLRYSDLEFNLNQASKFVKEVRETIDGLELVSSQLDDCVNLSIGYVELQAAIKNQEEQSLSTPETLDEEEASPDDERMVTTDETD
tara:strand:- start:463 stop:804 length:342 start_codon:yes stop_codon:yes gene_type:complete